MIRTADLAWPSETRDHHAMRTLVALALCASIANAQTAELIVTNARVYSLTWPDPNGEGRPASTAPYSTATGWKPDAQAVAIRGGRIMYVGTDSGALALRGPSTRLLDARGGTLLPGLADSHVHLANLGESLALVDLVGVETPAQAIERVVQRAATTPRGEWVVGYGWDDGAWANRYPDMTALSARVPNHPVWLRGLHTFAGWGNRLAFERAGITSSTVPPTGGEIRKDASGKPSGILLNNAVRLMEQAVPRLTPAQLDARMTAAMQTLVRAGYTAVTESNADSAMLASLERLAAAKRLPLRVDVLLSSADSALVKRWIARGPDTSRGAVLRVLGVKAFYDGALGSRGALLLADYADRPGHKGKGGADYAFNERLVTDAMRRGFQVAIHAIGDAANRQTLDLFERLFAQTPSLRARRHRIEHAQILAPAEIPRFARVGIIASMQPGHAVEDMAWAHYRVGPQRVRGGYAWRSLRRSGARLLFSSDLPGSSYDFSYMIHSAVARTDKTGKPTGGWLPSQRLTPEEAIRAYTTWAAYASFTESHAGAIKPGMWADLTLLAEDPLVVGTTNPEALLRNSIRATIVRGHIAYER
jgi:predicted amidohydrolase YtcJ